MLAYSSLSVRKSPILNVVLYRKCFRDRSVPFVSTLQRRSFSFWTASNCSREMIIGLYLVVSPHRWWTPFFVHLERHLCGVEQFRALPRKETPVVSGLSIFSGASPAVLHRSTLPVFVPAQTDGCRTYSPVPLLTLPRFHLWFQREPWFAASGSSARKKAWISSGTEKFTPCTLKLIVEESIWVIPGKRSLTIRSITLLSLRRRAQSRTAFRAGSLCHIVSNRAGQ